ncbi:MAG: TetR/AcrR family transcriptional regulator, partial [Bradyrhizobium sp.]
MKSRPRKRLTLDQRRKRILTAATRLFARRGYDGASMSGIAADAGITKPVLYDHFASKEALFETLLRSIREDLLAKGRAIGHPSASDELRFRAAIDAFFAFVEE